MQQKKENALPDEKIDKEGTLTPWCQGPQSKCIPEPLSQSLNHWMFLMGRQVHGFTFLPFPLAWEWKSLEEWLFLDNMDIKLIISGWNPFQRLSNFPSSSSPNSHHPSVATLLGSSLFTLGDIKYFCNIVTLFLTFLGCIKLCTTYQLCLLFNFCRFFSIWLHIK